MKVYKNKKDIDIRALMIIGAAILVLTIIICAIIFIPKIAGDKKDDGGGKIIITTTTTTTPKPTQPPAPPVEDVVPDYSQRPGVMQGITMSMLPKTIYYVGEALDPSGGKIQIIKDVQEGTYFLNLTDAGVEVSGFDSSVAVEEQVITVTYEGFTTTYTVTIKEYPTAPPKLESIEVVGLTTTYTLADWQDGIGINGVTLKLTYDNGSSEEISMKWNYIDPTEVMTAPGTTEMVFRYGGKTTTVTITITE